MKYLKFSLALLIIAFIGRHNVQPAEAAQSPAGSNILINHTIFLISADGKKMPYTSEGTFLSYGFNSFESVVPASEEDKNLPLGQPVPPRDGSLVCSNSSEDAGTCYLISEAKKVAITSMTALEQSGFSSENLITTEVEFVPRQAVVLSENTENQFAGPVQTLTANKPGTVVNLNGTAYLVGVNGLMGFPSLDVLHSWGYKTKDIVEANSADKQTPIRFPLERRFPVELRPYEPVLPGQLNLSEENKFTLPFAFPTLYQITESWLYSAEERAIHGYSNHGSVDFAVPRGTPIYAAADGYAVASTHLSPLSRSYNNTQPVGFGLGEFVQIWHPEQGVYTSYSHMGDQADTIPYFEPSCSNGFCDPKVLYNSTDYIQKVGKFVTRGELIGYAGDSGLALGETELPQSGRVHPSWDEVHLHFEIYTRNADTYGKARRYDPYGIYGRLDQYPGAPNQYHTLWMKDANGYTLFSR